MIRKFFAAVRVGTPWFAGFGTGVLLTNMAWFAYQGAYFAVALNTVVIGLALLTKPKSKPESINDE